MYTVYAIYSRAYRRIYIGMSRNIERRLLEHNNAQVRSTKAYCPWEVIYYELVGERSLARNKEKYYKTGFGREFIKQFIPG